MRGVVDIVQNLPQAVADGALRAHGGEEQLMGAVIQLQGQLLTHVPEGVAVVPRAKRVEGTDEDHIAGAKLVVLLSPFQLVDVQVGLIEPGPLGERGLTGGLQLDVVDRGTVVQVGVQTHTAAVERLGDGLLRLDANLLLGHLLLLLIQLIVLHMADPLIGQQVGQQLDADFGIADDVGEHEIIPDVHIVNACGHAGGIVRVRDIPREIGFMIHAAVHLLLPVRFHYSISAGAWQGSPALRRAPRGVAGPENPASGPLRTLQFRILCYNESHPPVCVCPQPSARDGWSHAAEIQHRRASL